MTILGAMALALFLGACLASIRGWIPQRALTLQTTLLLVAALIVILRLAFGKPPAFGEILGGTSLHPITATVAGFLLAGALQAAGGFDAASALLRRLTGTGLGLPFALVVLVNLPTIFAMPCGRILAAPLMPLALLLGQEAAERSGDRTMLAMVVFGMLVNAGASCVPSALGGIGLLGEGMGRFPAGSFGDPSQLGTLVLTLATMALIRFVHGRDLKMRPPATTEPSVTVPDQGYTALAVFVLMLALVMIVRPRIPLQVILTVSTLMIMALARLSLANVLAGVILHPLSAMIAGFLVAGALSASGGFDALLWLLEGLARHTPLGFVGVSILVVFLPLMLAMPCGRIMSVALIPGVLLFGEKVAHATAFPLAAPVLLVSFILSAAGSCGPSPLGGVGNIGEGRLRIPDFWSSRPQALGIFLGVPAAALVIRFGGVSGGAYRLSTLSTCLGFGLVSGLGTNWLFGYRLRHLGGLAGGLLVGLLVWIL
ncbi:MAG: hypothetical protein HY014_14610 [Acidobacteria bacterium]|nr:hypothetical protein [Acidobacteriota bacterium]MBI3489392.1 hypothetical protein [Acidobacteriota bacterium]